MKIFLAFLFTISSAFGVDISDSTSTEMVDLTLTLDNDGITYPAVHKYQMTVLQNGTTPQGFWLQLEDISGSTHVGTHVQTSCMVSPGRWSIEKIPLKRLVGIDAAIIDISERAALNPDAQLTVEDLRQWEHRTGRLLNDVIVVLRSNWDKRYPDAKRFLGTTTNDTSRLHFPAFSFDAARWLVKKRNIYAIGTDAVSPDFEKSSEPFIQQIVYSKNVYGVVMLANLNKLPICGVKFHILPLKLRGTCAAPSRVYATFQKSSVCSMLEKMAKQMPYLLK